MSDYDSFAGSKVRHGSASGYNKHHALREPPCDACNAAMTKVNKTRDRTAGGRKRNLALSRAQAYANRDLKAMYPEDYRRLYAAHRAAVFAEEGLT